MIDFNEFTDRKKRGKEEKREKGRKKGEKKKKKGRFFCIVGVDLKKNWSKNRYRKPDFQKDSTSMELR